MRRSLAWVLVLGAAACGRSEVYAPRRAAAIPVDPCATIGTTRPCKTVCGTGVEKCVDGFWTGCDAPLPQDPPSTLNMDATLRDFRGTHPDFEHLVGDDRGIVGKTLGADHTPAYPHDAGTKTVTSPQSFSQWFHDAPGINSPLPTSLALGRYSQTPLVYSYANGNFFPLDNQLFGNEGRNHNFHFTLEVHSALEYRGGEVLYFEGDDDLWVFVRDQLVVDLGGPHPTQSASVRLDDLGLTVGEVYPLDVFFAERHTSSSTLKVETTNARFVRCLK